MLSVIREKLKLWIVVVLLILVAIPLVFMGLGNYQTPQKSYSMIINDQVVSQARLEQEVFQYKRALNENYQGRMPPVYTDNFIKKITLEYMMRTILLDNAANEMGLKFHNKSVVSEIKNTTAFKDEQGFNQDLYKRQLIGFNMKPKDYELYVYQKGISQQLKSVITDTSFLTLQEKEDLANFRYHERKGDYVLIPFNQIKSKVNIPDNELQNYFNKNTNDFMTETKATFDYIDVDKFDLISSITTNKKILKEIYNEKLNNGEYFQPSSYKVNHILISNLSNDSPEKLKSIAEKAHNELKNGMSFSDVSKLYSNDDETKNNNGYLGEFFIDDLPNYLHDELRNLQIKEISNIIKSDKGFHIVAIKDMSSETNHDFSTVENDIINEYKTEHGTRLFFELVDKISEHSFQNNNDISQLAQIFNLNINTSKKVTPMEGYGIFNYEHIRNTLFSDDVIKNNYNSGLVHVNDNRFIVAKLKNHYAPEKLNFNDAKDAISILLITQQAAERALSAAKNIRDKLNDKVEIFEYQKNNFNLSLSSNDADSRIKQIIFGSNITKKYQYTKMTNGDYLVYNVESISYPKDTKKIYTDDNQFSNFIINTRSESEYNVFQQTLKNNADIKINESYLNLDQ